MRSELIPPLNLISFAYMSSCIHAHMNYTSQYHNNHYNSVYCIMKRIRFSEISRLIWTFHFLHQSFIHWKVFFSLHTSSNPFLRLANSLVHAKNRPLRCSVYHFKLRIFIQTNKKILSPEHQFMIILLLLYIFSNESCVQSYSSLFVCSPPTS